MLGLICTALLLYLLLVFVRAIMTWLPPPSSPVLIRGAQGVAAVVDPPLRRLRRVIPPVRLGDVQIDLSVLVLIIGVTVVRSILCS